MVHRSSRRLSQAEAPEKPAPRRAHLFGKPPQRERQAGQSERAAPPGEHPGRPGADGKQNQAGGDEGRRQPRRRRMQVHTAAPRRVGRFIWRAGIREPMRSGCDRCGQKITTRPVWPREMPKPVAKEPRAAQIGAAQTTSCGAGAPCSGHFVRISLPSRVACKRWISPLWLIAIGRWPRNSASLSTGAVSASGGVSVGADGAVGAAAAAGLACFKEHRGRATGCAAGGCFTVSVR